MNQAGHDSAHSAPLLLTIDEACDALRVSRSQLYDLFNKRRLKSVRINRRRFIVPADLTALIEELQEEGGE
jgi:excisionase family DNA binding protein